MTIRTIIAAIALENDEPVARRAIQFAAGHGAKLILVHAIENLPAFDADLPSPANEEAIAEMLAAEAVRSLKQMASSAAVPTQIEVRSGKAARIIERLVRDHAADLLVIGPGKPQNLRERIFGSTADQLVRSGSCPIVIAKRAGDKPYRRAVAAIDFSPMSLTAAQTAARIAPQAALELVHALEIPLAFEQAMLKVGTPQTEVDAFRQAKARAAYAELRSIGASLSVPGKVRILRGDPATALVRLARRDKTDLMALGIQGRSAVSKMVLGSVARRVLAGASCDILLVR